MAEDHDQDTPIDVRTLAGTTVTLEPQNGREPVHLFEHESVLAVHTALACGRPLLVRGEPGTGKSQLAAAIAKATGRDLEARVVDARTEPHELMWEYDALARLADVQALDKGEDKPERIDYTTPGPLWWAFEWSSAEALAKTGRAQPKHGVVVLIDEIDKADMAVPNALLECLGSGSFRVPGRDEPVKAKDDHLPLVMLTTNTDRVLPDAFVRRCVVLHMRVPDGDALVDWLVARGEVHFSGLSESLLRLTATLVVNARDEVRQDGVYCPPGVAEYIDLLAAVKGETEARAEQLVRQLGRFVLRKHRDPGPMSAAQEAEPS